MRDAGAAAVMPLGASIESNRGLQTKEMIRIMIEEIDVPIIIDACIGRPSEAAEAMEMGEAAVLVNTAIATAGDSASMAEAFAYAVKAGRQAFVSGMGGRDDRKGIVPVNKLSRLKEENGWISMQAIVN